MISISLPRDLEAWAHGEVAAGRAESVDSLIADSLAERREWDAFRRSLDETEAEAAEGAVSPAEEVFADLKSRYPAE
jgi:Arc/MetJ-type ribon-helix-helix transcriptional regulator